MKVIVLASCKGGAGKTTLACHLAVACHQATGLKVVLIDTDPQNSLKDWFDVRKEGSKLFIRADVGPLSRLSQQLKKLEELGVDYVFFDTPPAITQNIQAVLAVSDLVVIPTRPSPLDLRAIGRTIGLCENLKKPMVFVINGSVPRSVLSRLAASELSEHGPVCRVVVHQRNDFARSMLKGKSVLDEGPKNSASALEIQELWAYIEARLNKKLTRN